MIVEFVVCGYRYKPHIEHAYPHDLKELLEVLKPEILIPIHTENPYAFESILPEGTKLVVGRRIVISENKIEVRE